MACFFDHFSFTLPANSPLICAFILHVFESCHLQTCCIHFQPHCHDPSVCSIKCSKKCLHLLHSTLEKDFQAMDRGHEHITPVLKLLCWLPMNLRFQFKVLPLVSKCCKGLPTYQICFYIINPRGPEVPCCWPFNNTKGLF